MNYLHLHPEESCLLRKIQKIMLNYSENMPCTAKENTRRELFAEKNRKIMLNYSDNMSCTAKENTNKAHFTIKQQKN